MSDDKNIYRGLSSQRSHHIAWCTANQCIVHQLKYWLYKSKEGSSSVGPTPTTRWVPLKVADPLGYTRFGISPICLSSCRSLPTCKRQRRQDRSCHGHRNFRTSAACVNLCPSYTAPYLNARWGLFDIHAQKTSRKSTSVHADALRLFGTNRGQVTSFVKLPRRPRDRTGPAPECREAVNKPRAAPGDGSCGLIRRCEARSPAAGGG